MKQHVELGIIVAMSAMMVFAMTAYMTPSANAASVSGGSGGSGTSGASGASASGSKGGAGGAGSNPAKTTTGGGSTSGGSTSGGSTSGGSTSGGSTSGGSSSGGYKGCIPGKCLGDPGYYTTNGHHHCFDGAPGCACTDPHKCTVGSALIRPGSIMTTV